VEAANRRLKAVYKQADQRALAALVTPPTEHETPPTDQATNDSFHSVGSDQDDLNESTTMAGDNLVEGGGGGDAGAAPPRAFEDINERDADDLFVKVANIKVPWLKDLKLALKASLQQMGNESGSKWVDRLPWIMLGRRTAFQPDLDATSAELVFGSNPALPGDIYRVPGKSLTSVQLQTLLEGLRRNAAQPAVPMSSHRDHKVNLPDKSAITHVRVRRAKPGVLGHTWAGPFQITEYLGDTCVKLRVGSFADGRPRYEVQHWDNLKPAVTTEATPMGHRPTLGRKPSDVTEPVIIQEERPHLQERGISPNGHNVARKSRDKDEMRVPSAKDNERTESDSGNRANTRPQRARCKPVRYRDQ